MCLYLTSMLTTNICLYTASLRPFSKCWLQKITLMADKCGYNNVHLILMVFGTNQHWNEYNKANYFNSNIFFHKEILILTPKTLNKWPPRNHFVMLVLKYG